MHNERTNIVDVCNHLVASGAFPDAATFWLGFLTYARRNLDEAEKAQVDRALAWVEQGGLDNADLPQTEWFHKEFCRLEFVVVELRSYLQFRGLEQHLDGFQL